MHDGKRLIRATGTPPAIRGIGRVDPHFALAVARSMPATGDHPVDPMATIRSLGQRIHDRPGDLHAHLHRIRLLEEHGTKSMVSGAMADLFIALGRYGRPLRERLLAEAEPFLPKTAAIFLRRRLDDGLGSDDPGLARIRHTMLTQGVTGRLEILRRDARTPTAFADPDRREAARLARVGQIEAARKRLEAALRESPADAAIAAELLAIYGRSTGNVARDRMTAWFERQGLPLPDGWPASSQQPNAER